MRIAQKPIRCIRSIWTTAKNSHWAVAEALFTAFWFVVLQETLLCVVRPNHTHIPTPAHKTKWLQLKYSWPPSNETLIAEHSNDALDTLSKVRKVLSDKTNENLTLNEVLSLVKVTPIDYSEALSVSTKGSVVSLATTIMSPYSWPGKPTLRDKNICNVRGVGMANESTKIKNYTNKCADGSIQEANKVAWLVVHTYKPTHVH